MHQPVLKVFAGVGDKHPDNNGEPIGRLDDVQETGPRACRLLCHEVGRDRSQYPHQSEIKDEDAEICRPSAVQPLRLRPCRQ